MTQPEPASTRAHAPAAAGSDEARIDEIVRQGPAGTFAVVGLATFVVVAIFFIFYFFAFLPRGVVQ